ncbi:MAG TPA: glycerophosphodiester phosphodiesterase [Firmicutes bacterium]|uniref:Glycerophosphodiester phosphodiesterase n=1 Tax=Capillibacterium thermochitinicola TaxID=2699427 RepID=A0A8J6I1S2_9FIRM|nr:glycerophosphodiester phosphodiesterase family protein [Capillibacterium thermochitinicola]MBA2132697.1 glycerophosphodiester phosphodiesterase [Capillibacterium thermochitinicola]HHW12700.1 glycerophosphodiester phosphodiesterase [Bacillota bacterium]
MPKARLLLSGIIIITVVGVAYLLNRLPKTVAVMEPTNFPWLYHPLIAHRGLHDNNHLVPENSMPAFAKAIEEGYAIELDVAMTNDQQLVVYHDKKLRRGMGVDRYLAELTFAELSAYKIFGSEQTVPLFRDVLSLVAGRVPLFIEVKNEGKVGEMERRLYEELQGYPGPYAIMSFNPFTLQWFRQNAPEVPRGQLAGSFEVSDYEVEYAGTTRLPWYKKIVLEHLLLNFISRPHFIAYEIKNTSPDRLARLKKLGIPLLGWTVKNKAEYEEYKGKFDNLIIDAVLPEL